jgi:hypothetical protein
MTPIAIPEQLDGKAVDGMEQVRPYQAGYTRQEPQGEGEKHARWHSGFRLDGRQARNHLSPTHKQPHTLQPKESLRLRFRVLVHSGTPAEAKVADEYEGYCKEAK